MVLELDQSNEMKGFETNLWQITIQSHENFANNKNPEENFLLNSVQQIITGTDFTMQLFGDNNVLDQYQQIGEKPVSSQVTGAKKNTSVSAPIQSMMAKNTITSGMQSMVSMVGVAKENENISKESQVQYVKFVLKEECASPVYAIFED